MDRASMDKGRLVRIPIHRTKDYRKICKIQKEFKEQYNHTPSLEYVADCMDRPVEFVSQIIDDHQSVLSLQYYCEDAEGDEYSSFADALIQEEENHVEQMEQDSCAAMVRQYLGELSHREQTVLSLRFGLNNNECYTFEAVSEILNLSRERIRQIQVKAMEKIQLAIESDDRHALIDIKEEVVV